MKEFGIKDTNDRFSLPENMDELTASQADSLFKYYLLAEAKEISLHDFKIYVVIDFIGTKYNEHRLKLLDELARTKIYQNIAYLADQLSWLFTIEDNQVSLSLEFTKNLFPKVKGLYGPAEAMTDLSFHEYQEAHAHFFEFAQTRDPEELNQMIAVIYRRKKPFLFLQKFLPWYDGKEKISYRPWQTKFRLRKVRRIPWHIRYGIFFNWIAWEKFLKEGEIEIEGKPISFSILYEKHPLDEKNSSDFSADIGLTGIIYQLAESSLFGNVKATREEGLYDIMLRLYQKRIEYLQHRENMKKYGTTD